MQQPQAKKPYLKPETLQLLLDRDQALRLGDQRTKSSSHTTIPKKGQERPERPHNGTTQNFYRGTEKLESHQTITDKVYSHALANGGRIGGTDPSELPGRLRQILRTGALETRSSDSHMCHRPHCMSLHQMKAHLPLKNLTQP